MKKIELEQLDKEELAEIVKASVSEVLKMKAEDNFEKQTFNIKDAAKILKRSENYLRKIVTQGILKTTSDGKFITGKELNRYLGE